MICPNGHYVRHDISKARFCPTCGTALVNEVGSAERELVAGEIVGWRTWDVLRLGKVVRLGSVSARQQLASGDTAPVIWPTDRYFEAACGAPGATGPGCMKSSDGRCPGEGCSCGLYAAQTFEQLTRRLPYAQYKNTGEKVIGEVAMIGKVIVGTQGYKAERARIAHVYVPHGAWKVGREIAEQYNVPYDLLRWIG